MMVESNIMPDSRVSSKPIVNISSKPRNVNSQRSRRNIQQAFGPSSIKLLSVNYPHFFIVDLEEISLKLYVTIPENNLPLLLTPEKLLPQLNVNHQRNRKKFNR